jgi:hypothetical protein
MQKRHKAPRSLACTSFPLSRRFMWSFVRAMSSSGSLARAQSGRKAGELRLRLTLAFTARPGPPPKPPWRAVFSGYLFCGAFVCDCEKFTARLWYLGCFRRFYGFWKWRKVVQNKSAAFPWENSSSKRA